MKCKHKNLCTLSVQYYDTCTVSYMYIIIIICVYVCVRVCACACACACACVRVCVINIPESVHYIYNIYWLFLLI